MKAYSETDAQLDSTRSWSGWSVPKSAFGSIKKTRNQSRLTSCRRSAHDFGAGWGPHAFTFTDENRHVGHARRAVIAHPIPQRHRRNHRARLRRAAAGP